MFGSTKSVKKIIETKNPYAVKAVKSFMGREGYGYECSLYKDGKRIGTVTDVADGGGMLQCYLNDGEEEKLEAYCDTLPPEKYESFTVDIDPCIFVSGLVEEWETKAKLKKSCRGKTCYRLTTDKDTNTYWIMKTPFTAEVKKHLQKKYGEALKEIINETL